MCSAAAESAKTNLWYSSGNPGHVTRLSSGGAGRDTSPLSGTLAGAQCRGEGWAWGAGSHSIHTPLFLLLRFKKMLGSLIISIVKGLFKTGHVKVRGLGINHTDSSFPPAELVWLCSYPMFPCRRFMFATSAISLVTISLQYF